jgi:hypothetical protein
MDQTLLLAGIYDRGGWREYGALTSEEVDDALQLVEAGLLFIAAATPRGYAISARGNAHMRKLRNMPEPEGPEESPNALLVKVLTAVTAALSATEAEVGVSVSPFRPLITAAEAPPYLIQVVYSTAWGGATSTLYLTPDRVHQASQGELTPWLVSAIEPVKERYDG